MAIQGKGILGNPKGRILDKVFYTQREQGLIRSAYTVEDAYLRARPLIKYRLTQIANQLWLAIKPSAQATWATAAEPGETPQEAYTRITLNAALARRLYFMGGIRIANLGGRERINVTIKPQGNKNQMLITIPENSVYWTIGGNVKAQVRYYKGTTQKGIKFYTLSQTSFAPFNIPVDPLIFQNSVVARITFSKGSTTNILNDVAGPFYNPDNL